jgi:hypothetical protein
VQIVVAWSWLPLRVVLLIVAGPACRGGDKVGVDDDGVVVVVVAIRHAGSSRSREELQVVLDLDGDLDWVLPSWGVLSRRCYIVFPQGFKFSVLHLSRLPLRWLDCLRSLDFQRCLNWFR